MNALKHLRDKTHSAHSTMEQLAPLSRIFAPDYQSSELAQLLTAMLGIYTPLEAVLAHEDEAGYIPRVPLIRQGLEHLGQNPVLPPPIQIPTFSNRAEKLGGLYVLEGSTLGGQVIHQKLMAHFGESIKPALSFFTPYCDAARSHWQSFCLGLERELNTEEALQSAASAALATFEMFAKGLNAPARP